VPPLQNRAWRQSAAATEQSMAAKCRRYGTTA